VVVDEVVVVVLVVFSTNVVLVSGTVVEVEEVDVDVSGGCVVVVLDVVDVVWGTEEVVVVV
jgi:hypothetical protein